MIKYDMDALEYISKLSDGGLRDAISLMDKALAYSTELTLENVVTALGTTDYDTMFKLAKSILSDQDKAIECIEDINNAGKDLKQFVKQFTQFLIDVQKYDILGEKAWQYINIPKLNDYEKELGEFDRDTYSMLLDLLNDFVKLNANIKYSSVPKYDIEATIILFGMDNETD